ncbi:MAG TPA: hypothetical protein VHO27_02485 [Angustibacter sp.]|nr:hypothetical protein [Angustibacter sp.]
MDLDEVVDELYALDPGEFTARRDALAAEAKRDGEAELAKQLKALRRPTAGAYAVNQLARDAADDLAAYLELGARLRDAQAGLKGDQLRALGQDRQRAAAELVATAAELVEGGLSDTGRAEVDATLRAAVADPAAAEAVASGRLTKALAYAGFGEVDLTAVTATPLTGGRPAGPAAPPEQKPKQKPERKSRTKSPPKPRGEASQQRPDREPKGPPPPSRADQVLARRREQAERDLADAERAVQQARQDAAAAQAARDEAQQTQSDAEARVDALREQLTQARFAVRDAQREATGAASAWTAAEKALAAAEKAAARARDRLDHLSERPAR